VTYSRAPSYKSGRTKDFIRSFVTTFQVGIKLRKTVISNIELADHFLSVSVLFTGICSLVNIMAQLRALSIDKPAHH